MQNGSSLSIDYQIRLESLSLLRHTHAKEIPPFIDPKKKSQVGVQNNNGQNVFDLVPAEGMIAPGMVAIFNSFPSKPLFLLVF